MKICHEVLVSHIRSPSTSVPNYTHGKLHKIYTVLLVCSEIHNHVHCTYKNKKIIGVVHWIILL